MNYKHLMSGVIFALSLTAPIIGAAQAQSSGSSKYTTSNQQIAEQLEAFAKSINDSEQYTRISHEVTLPDPRLNLEICKAPLDIENRSPNRKIGRLTVRVSCKQATKPWAVNISMNLVAYDDVVVASRPIPKGSKILPNMLMLMERNVTNMHQGYFKTFKHVVGSVSKYTINGNRTLKPGSLLPPTLVAKGEKVVINAKAGGLSIRATGVSLDDGAMGELIKVKNTQTKRIIEGRVSAAGQISVSL